MKTMMKCIKTIFLVMLFMTFQSFALESLSGSVSGSSQEYVEFDLPPLFLLKADEAAKLRDIVATAPYDKAYKTLIANADAMLGDKPQPLEKIIYGGHVSNHPDRVNTVRHLQDMTKIYTLTWANFVSGKSKYGKKAIEFVEAWAQKCKPSGHDINDKKLLTCMVAYQMLREEMTKEQKKKIGKWVKSIGDALQERWSDKKNGNRAGKRLMLIYFAAYLDDDQDRIEWVQPKIQRIWNSTLFGTGESVDLKRRDAMHYHFSTVSAFLQVAQIGRLTGRYHYNQKADNGGSIAKAIEFALPFIKGEKIHPEWVNSTTKLDHERWEAGDPYYKPGKPWDPWEGYKSLMLASVFDESLHRMAEKLRRDKNETLPWYAVLARASLADDADSGFSQEYVEFDAAPLFLLKADEAAKLRDIVAVSPYDKAYKTLIANADAALGDKPQPLKKIIYEGRVSNHPDRLNTVRHLQDMTKIYTLTWASFVSGKSKYGAKAIEFVEAWAKKCKPSGGDVNDNKLLTCMFAYQMLREEMTKEQKKEIGKWVKSIGDVQQKGWSGKKRGNHAGKRLKLIYFAAYLENDKDRIKWVQSKIQQIWNSTLFKDGETYDFQRRDALSYHFSTVRAFLQIAHIGRLTGKGHYNQEADDGGSIAESIDFALPYIKGEKIHPEWVNTIVKLDKERWAKAGDPYYKPGKPWDRWEGYKSLMLASVFDESLHDWAEKLRQDKNKPLPWYAVLARASMADNLNSSHADYSLTAAVSSPVRSGLIVTDLGKNYSYNPEVTPANLYFDDTDKGGNTSTSVRNDSYDNLEWKDDEGYYQRNRDLGMIFNPIKNITLDAIVLRTSGSNKAVKTGAPDAPVIMQIFEVVGTPVLNNNGTGAGDTAEGRFQDSHASDDNVEGVEYVQLLLATGGTFPIHDVTSSRKKAGKLRFMRWDITNDMQLIGGKRYMFLVGFEKPIYDCSMALANTNPINAQSKRGNNIYLHTDPAGKKWWGVRREGNSTYPPTRAPGSDPISEPGEPLRSQLKTESMFKNDRLTNPDDDPTSDGFPSIDTYRTLQFYIETTDGGTSP